MKTRRTTIMLRPQDDENLQTLSRMMSTTDTETIRRALRMMNRLLAWDMEGGKIVLRNSDGRDQERVMFL